jgi:hypothetical protein
MPAVPYRTGIPTIQIVALRLCRLLDKFAPLINLYYGDDPLVGPALAAAQASCAELRSVLEAHRQYGD